MRSNFKVFGNAILGLGTRSVRDWYAIKVLIISSVTRLHDFSQILRGIYKKIKKNIYMGEYRNGIKSRYRVPESFCGVFVAESFCGVFGGWEFLWGFWQKMADFRLFRQWLQMQLSCK